MSQLLTGSFRVPSAFTAECTANGTTGHVAFTAGEFFASQWALVAAFAARATVATGTAWTGTVYTTGALTWRSRFTATGPITIHWSHIGDGSALRDRLGWAGDIVASASPLTAPVNFPTGLALTRPLHTDDLTRVGHRPHGTHVDGTPWVASETGPARSHVRRRHALRFWLESWEAGYFETFWTELFAAQSEPFALFPDSSVSTGGTYYFLDGDTVRMEVERLDPRSASPLVCSLTAVEAV